MRKRLLHSHLCFCAHPVRTECAERMAQVFAGISSQRYTVITRNAARKLLEPNGQIRAKRHMWLASTLQVTASASIETSCELGNGDDPVE